MQFAYFDAGAYREHHGPAGDYTWLIYNDLVTCYPGFVWLWRGDVLVPLEAAEGGRWRVLPPNVVDESEETGDALLVYSKPGDLSAPDMVDAADPRLAPFRLEPKPYPQLMPPEVAAALGIALKVASPG